MADVEENLPKDVMKTVTQFGKALSFIEKSHILLHAGYPLSAGTQMSLPSKKQK